MRRDDMSGTIFHRQLDIFDPSQYDVPITIIGVGATGSWDAICLAKMGFNDITIFDHDKVEAHNTGSQVYGLRDVDFPKCNALARIMEETCDTSPKVVTERWDGAPLHGIVIMGADSMEVRRLICKSCAFKPSVQLVIDHRIGGQKAQIFTFSPTNLDALEDYELTLFEEDEASQLPCTLRAVADINLMVASMVARSVRTFLVDGESAINYELHYDAEKCAFIKRQPGGAYQVLE